MVMAKTAVVVRRSPAAAVAVNNERSIFKNDFINTNYLFVLKLY